MIFIPAVPLPLQVILSIFSARFPQPQRRHNTTGQVLEKPSVKRILQVQSDMILHQ